MITILIAILTMWSIVNSFLSVTAILAVFSNHKDIEAIKSWYPFRKIFKEDIPKKDFNRTILIEGMEDGGIHKGH